MDLPFPKKIKRRLAHGRFVFMAMCCLWGFKVSASESILNSCAEYIDHPGLISDWKERIKDYQKFETCWRDFDVIVATEYEKQLKIVLEKLCSDQSITLDPWSLPNQETDFVPPFEEVKFSSGPAVESFGGVDSKKRIPPLFRLAELLGLGQNSMHLEVFRTQPAFKTHQAFEFAVVSQVRNDLVGVFRLNGLTDRVETVRLSIETHLPIGYAVLRMGPKTKPHKFGIEYRSLESDYMQHSWESRAWERQGLASRIAEHAVTVIPARAQQRKFQFQKQKVTRSVERMLQEIRGKLIDQLKQPLEALIQNGTTQTIQSLISWEATAPQSSQGLLWGQRILEISKLQDAFAKGCQKHSPLHQAKMTAQSQLMFGKLALINGLRLRLPPSNREEVTQYYLSLILSLNSTSDKADHADPSN